MGEKGGLFRKDLVEMELSVFCSARVRRSDKDIEKVGEETLCKWKIDVF